MEIIERYNKMKDERESIIYEKRKSCEDKYKIVQEKQRVLKNVEEDFFNAPTVENEKAYKVAKEDFENSKAELDHADSIFKVLTSKELKLKCTSEEIKQQAIEYINSLNFNEDVDEFYVKFNEIEEIVKRANVKHDKVRTMLENIKKIKDHIELTDKDVNIENMIFNVATKTPKFVPKGVIDELKIEPIVASIGFTNWIEEGTRERNNRLEKNI